MHIVGRRLRVYCFLKGLIALSMRRVVMFNVLKLNLSLTGTEDAFVGTRRWHATDGGPLLGAGDRNT